eukprot:scaffold535_cov163-Skeletonema_menzelii.AAC.1
MKGTDRPIASLWHTVVPMAVGSVPNDGQNSPPLPVNARHKSYCGSLLSRISLWRIIEIHRIDRIVHKNKSAASRLYLFPLT